MAADAIRSDLNYLRDVPREKPAVYLHQPLPEDHREGPQLGPREVVIEDARTAVQPRLDVEGLELVRQPLPEVDYYDADCVRESYYPQVESLVRETTGARRVVAFDHNLRSMALAERREHGAQMPVRFAHNDYTEESGPQRVRDLLPAEADDLLLRRFAVVNVWRPIRGPVEATPLAVCDAQSMGPDDLVSMDLIYPDRVGEIQAMRFDAGHRWLSYPRMETSEVILLKCYDSALDGRARFTAHSAFDDPTTPADAAPRESIEVRTLAFFDEAR